MSLHKLSAGDGYTYLTPQVAAADDGVITRHNDRRLTLSATDWVANGDRWTVTSVRTDGALEVRHAPSRRRVTLPAGYVAEHVQLGYACTVHAAQGQTVDTGLTVMTGGESRQLLYVALTRGRHANSVHLDVSIIGDDAALDAAARLAETIHPGITADPQWPTLAHQLAAADRAGIDHAELRRIATGRPLPIEQPAAALAYRVIDAIGERPTSAQPPKPAPPRPYETNATGYPTARLSPPGAEHPTGPSPMRRRVLLRGAERLEPVRTAQEVSWVPRPATISDRAWARCWTAISRWYRPAHRS